MKIPFLKPKPGFTQEAINQEVGRQVMASVSLTYLAVLDDFNALDQDGKPIPEKVQDLLESGELGPALDKAFTELAERYGETYERDYP